VTTSLCELWIDIAQLDAAQTIMIAAINVPLVLVWPIELLGRLALGSGGESFDDDETGAPIG
jgi:hypothetical protein